MPPELVGNIGYLAFKKQTVKTTPVKPDTYLPLYDETMQTNAGFVDQLPIYGGKHGRFATLQGQRSHQGDLTTIAEPNTTAYLLDMLATKGSTTGSNPYTHPYDFLATSNPKAYTVDLSLGNVVKRFWGFELSSMAPNWNENELQWKLQASALGSFQVRTIASVDTTEIVLDTKYDPNPSLGLVTGDLVRIYKEADGTTLDTTVSTVDADGVTVTLGASAAAFAAGDIIHLRPATPTFDLLPTFLWAKTQFHFGADATAALAADQTQVEQGSVWEILHPFEDDGGSKRSGGFDPASLVRLASDATVQVKKFLNTPEDIKAWNDRDKRALIIRMFSGDTNQYECRILFYNLTIDTPSGSIVSNEVTYATLNPKVNYDPTAGKAVAMTVINAKASI